MGLRALKNAIRDGRVKAAASAVSADSRRHGDNRECLIDLEQIDIPQRPSAALHQLLKRITAEHPAELESPELLRGVIHGATDLLLELFGPEAGWHARSAVGLYQLPGNCAVEIEIIVEVRD